jgi:predicted component of type VI protein secretion system
MSYGIEHIETDLEELMEAVRDLRNESQTLDERMAFGEVLGNLMAAHSYLQDVRRAATS